MLIIGIDPGISGSICFFEILEDDDDVQNIYSNAKFLN